MFTMGNRCHRVSLQSQFGCTQDRTYVSTAVDVQSHVVKSPPVKGDHQSVKPSTIISLNESHLHFICSSENLNRSLVRSLVSDHNKVASICFNF